MSLGRSITLLKKHKSQWAYVYQVSSCYDVCDIFILDINLNLKISKCDGQLYNFMGILYSDILIIFQEKKIIEIPN